jgi:DNA polymerase-1
MQVIDSIIEGDPVKIFCPEPGDFRHPGIYRQWRTFVTRDRFKGLDVESLPLDVLDPRNMWGQYRGSWTRTVQFGDMSEAWVLRTDDEDQRREAGHQFNEPLNQFTTWTDIDVRAVYADWGIDITARYFDGITLALLRSPGQFTTHKLKDTCQEYGMPEVSAGDKRLKARQEELRVRRPSDSIKQKKGESDLDWAARRISRTREQDQYDLQYPVCGWNEWRDIPVSDLVFLEYAGLDAIGARRLWPKQVQSCRDYGIPTETIKRELHRQQRVVRRTITRGMVVDRAFTELQLSTIGKDHQEAKAEFQALTGLKAGSPFRAKWFEEQGLDFGDKRTDSGEGSLAKENVKDLLAKYAQDKWAPTLTPIGHQALKLVRRISETKNLTDFCTSLLKFMDPAGVVRPSVRILGAETGRHTVTAPAVQTLSSSNPVRGCFPAPEGFVLASIDLSQIEVRIVAALSGETKLIEAFERGEDAYNNIAESLFGPNFTKRERSIAKRILLAGCMYGGGVDTICTQLHDIDGITVEPELISDIRKDFRKKYRKITQYGYKVNTGDDVWLYSGRYVPGDRDRTYRGINSACQGSGRDILMDTEDRVCELGYEEAIVLDIHDEILFMLPVKGLRQALLDLRRAFQVPFKGVKVTCDIEVYAERWGHDMLVPRPEGLCRTHKDPETKAVTYELVKEWV